MKIVIDYQGIKREINGSFKICGSATDLEALMNQLRYQMKQDKPFCYGWVNIFSDYPVVIPNTKPIGWLDHA